MSKKLQPETCKNIPKEVCENTSKDGLKWKNSSFNNFHKFRSIFSKLPHHKYMIQNHGDAVTVKIKARLAKSDSVNQEYSRQLEAIFSSVMEELKDLEKNKLV